ncbi:MAG: PKD domain-containing protein [Crocinitomicaceae bacterium]|nr:PKD domain-containing protein [Crocinitomicaceae bacterium]
MTRPKSLKNIMLKKFFNLIVSFFAGTTVVGAVEPISVLFIGNSYTHQNRMPKLFEKIAKSKGMNVHVEMSAKSSHTFEMHCNRPDMFSKINSRKWDYVVLQGFSRELSYSPDHIDSASVPYFDKIIDSIYSNNPCTNVMLYMTWGYKNGYADRAETNSYEKMTNCVYNGYQYLSKKYQLPIAPVGHVWREVRKTSPIDLYQKDDQHPTIYGSYLAASTFYASIFKSSPIGAKSGSMDVESVRRIQRTAYDYVIANQDEFNLNDNGFLVSHVDDAYLINAKVNLMEGQFAEWQFGDGSTADTSKVTHEYKSSGNYVLELKIRDLKGTRRMQRLVQITSKDSDSNYLAENRQLAILPEERKGLTNKEQTIK